jgi:hypothetical protein
MWLPTRVRRLASVSTRRAAESRNPRGCGGDGRVACGLNVTGSIDFNQRDVAIVQARSGGFVVRVYARAPGDVIGAGAPIADVQLPEWGGAQGEFLAVRRLGRAELTAAARQRLKLMGMSDALIGAVERTGRTNGTVTIRSPIGGRDPDARRARGQRCGPRPVDALPDLSDVQVIIRTSLSGPGAADRREPGHLSPLTTTMLSVPGARVVRGYSFFGDSFVYVLFDDGTDLYWARSRVLEYLNQVQSRLPARRHRAPRSARRHGGGLDLRIRAGRQDRAARSGAAARACRTGSCATS